MTSRWRTRRRASRRGQFVRGLTAAILLVVAGGVWLSPPQSYAALSDWLRQASANVFTLAVGGLLVSILALGAPFLLRSVERRESAVQQRHAHDRNVMLARVRHRWITGVLDLSENSAVHLDLAMRRLPHLLDETTSPPAEQAIADIPFREIAVRFDAAGGGMLILGPPGSGKTTALLEITRSLLDQAADNPDLPMPVVFNLTSWSALRAPLTRWIIGELRTAYKVPRSIAERWLSRHEILPILDGLDEVAPDYRASCITTINRFLSDYGLVRTAVSCRSDDYATIPARLQVEEVLEIARPSRQQVVECLSRAGDELADVGAALGDDPTLWEFVRSPLVMDIVARTYRNRPADALRAEGSPSERLRLLFDAYTARMLEHRTGAYSGRQARRFLNWLARSMDERGQSEFYLDRLDPDWLARPLLRRTATLAPTVLVAATAVLVSGIFRGPSDAATFGIFFLVVFGFPRSRSEDRPGWRRVAAAGLLIAIVLGALSWVFTGHLSYGLVEGLFFGVFGGLMFELRRVEPAEEVGWTWRRAYLGLLVGITAGFICGSAYALASPGLDELHGLILGVFFGAACSLAYGLTPKLSSERTVPNEGIHRSARHAGVIGLTFGLLFALPFAIDFGIGWALEYEIFFGATGALIFGGVTCLQHGAVRALLVMQGAAPVRYVQFLDSATDQLLLRRAGGGYIFIHRLVLEHLARLDRPG